MTDVPPDVEYATADALCADAPLGEADVYVPGRGLWVRVRALTRLEVMGIQRVKDGPDRTATVERKMLALAMVRPIMTERAVGDWQKSSAAGEMDPVTGKVNELSGIGAPAEKEAYREFETDPEAEFHVPAG